MRLIAIMLPFLLTGGALATGGWETQTIDLTTGWNLVWLEVEPSDSCPTGIEDDFGVCCTEAGTESDGQLIPREVCIEVAMRRDHPSFVFTDPDIEAVCGFVAGQGLGDRGAWRCFYSGQPDFLSNLPQVQGDRGYFVLSTADTQITITGRPQRRSRPIAGGAPALFGAAVDFPAPEFDEYFAIGDAIDRISEVNTFDGVDDDFDIIPTAFPIDSNVAYWLTTDADQDYAGPLRLKTGGNGLQFGKNHYALELEIEVPLDTSNDQTVTIDVLDSVAPPVDEPSDDSAGDTDWLQYRFFNDIDEELQWSSFDAPLDVVIPAGETTATVILRADRKDKLEACIDTTNSLYQALIQVTDEVGHREVIGAGMEVLDNQIGTWMGDVTLDTVELHSSLPPPPGNANSAEPMRFGMLLEIPEVGDPRILDKVCLAIGATYDEYDNVLSYEEFKTFRSVMFPEVIDLDGSLDGTYFVAADHPLNPYRHRYNPEHTNTGANGTIAYEFTRTIDIEITADDPAPGDLFFGNVLRERAGNNVLVGTYTEVISGLSAEDIIVSGTFRLVRLSEETGLRDCPNTAPPE